MSNAIIASKGNLREEAAWVRLQEWPRIILNMTLGVFDTLRTFVSMKDLAPRTW